MLIKDSTAVVLHASQLLGRYNFVWLGCVAKSVTCLATDACLGHEFNPGPVPYFRGD